MGISHEYHSAPRRRTRGGISGKLRLAGVIVAILLVAYAVTAILEKGTAEEESTPQTGAGGIAQNILAPLPMQGEAASGSGSESTADSSGTAQAVQLESFGPARQTDGAYTIKAYDASVIRQPACGRQPRRRQEPHSRAGGSAGCAGSGAAQKAVYPAGH